MSYGQSGKSVGKSVASTALFIFITIILVIAGCIACCVMCCCYVLKKGKSTFTRGVSGTHTSTAMTTGGSCVSAGTCGSGRSIGGKSVTVVNDPSSIYPNPNPSTVPPMGPPLGASMAPQGGYGMPYPSYPISNPTYPNQPNMYPNTYQSHPPDNPPPYNPYYPQ